MACWKARGPLPISANWTFLLALTVQALWADIDQNCGVRKGGGGSLWAKISGRRWSFTNDSWHQKTIVHGLSRGVVCVTLRLAVLIQYWRVTDTETDTDTRRRLIPAHHYRHTGKMGSTLVCSIQVLARLKMYTYNTYSWHFLYVPSKLCKFHSR